MNKDELTYIKENYFKILLYNKQIKVIKKIIERKKEDLVIIKLKYDAGKENSASVMEMEADLKESEYNLLEQEENVKTIKTKLYLLMGVETNYEINTENYKDNFPKIIYDDIVEKVEKNYPNLNIVKLQIQIEIYLLVYQSPLYNLNQSIKLSYFFIFFWHASFY